MPERATKDRRHFCAVCGRRRESCPDAHLSLRGQCLDCAQAGLSQAARELAEHNGPHFDTWRQSMARSVGAVLPEQ